MLPDVNLAGHKSQAATLVVSLAEIAVSGPLKHTALLVHIHESFWENKVLVEKEERRNHPAGLMSDRHGLTMTMMLL